MGMQIPGELADLLNDLGYTWPKSDEEKLFELGQDWITFGGAVQQAADDADSAAQGAWTGNIGDAVEAFQKFWNDEKSASHTTHAGASGSQAVGAALIVCAAVVLALKINVIIQLVTLAIEIAEAIATAAPTFGASLLEIPVFKEITNRLMQLIINEAIGAILG